MNPELVKKAQQLIMKEETEIAEALQYHKNKKTGEFTEKGKSLWGFWNPVVRKMKEVLDVFLEDEELEQPPNQTLIIANEYANRIEKIKEEIVSRKKALKIISMIFDDLKNFYKGGFQK